MERGGKGGKEESERREITQALGAATSLQLTSSAVTEGTECPSSPGISVVSGIFCLLGFLVEFGVVFLTTSVFLPSSYLRSWCINRESKNP